MRAVAVAISPPEPSIYEAFIDLIEQAETAERNGHFAESLICLGYCAGRIKTHLAERAH